MKHFITLISCLTLASIVAVAMAQRPPRGPGQRGGFGQRDLTDRGSVGPNRKEIQLLADHDADNNGWLDDEERRTARAEATIRTQRRGGPGGPPAGGPGFAGPGFAGPGGSNLEEVKPGPSVSPEQVTTYPDADLYDPSVLRTIFVDFANADWEKELEDFHGTDVDVPATLTVDGIQYPGVGVHFRGASSFHHVPSGHKRSINLAMDLVDPSQRLLGYKSLNLLNAHGDASLMSTVLYSHVASAYLAVPKANFVKVVINGESWGVYTNVQQFDKTFLKENYGASKGTRWKVSGSPNGDGGLRYLGDDLQAYQSRFAMKSDDGQKAWRALVELCKVLNETPSDQLIDKLNPILEIDGVLAFLALDVALVNHDGYWTRASDYSIFRDGDGKFHLIPHDMNEAFQDARPGPGGPGPRRPEPGGPGGRFGRDIADALGIGGGPRGLRRGGPHGSGPGGGGPGRAGGVLLDPLVGLDDERFPLRSKLLAVPELRAKYMALIDRIANDSMTWQSLGPIVQQSRKLISDEVALDTRKLTSTAAFDLATTTDGDDEASLRSFVTRRGDYLRSRAVPTRE